MKERQYLGWAEEAQTDYIKRSVLGGITFVPTNVVLYRRIPRLLTRN